MRLRRAMKKKKLFVMKAMMKENKTVTISFRCKESEAEQIYQKKDEAGYRSISKFIRSALLKAHVVRVEQTIAPRDERDGIKKLANATVRIGQNYNQFVKTVSGRPQLNYHQIKTLLDGQQKQIQLLLDLWHEFATAWMEKNGIKKEV